MLLRIVVALMLIAGFGVLGVYLSVKAYPSKLKAGRALVEHLERQQRRAAKKHKP